MDRKRHQGIMRYVSAYFLFSCLFLLFLCFLARYETVREQRQMLSLLVKHPELEAEIIGLWGKSQDSPLYKEVSETELFTARDIVQTRYGFDLGKISSKRIYFVFGAIALIVSAALTGCIACIEFRRNKRGADSREMLSGLQEYLSALQKGSFCQIPEYGNASESWMKVWESARELGIYFESLKKRLEEEEENTKALITDISHQLKTPLASLQMSYELVVSENITEEERKEFQEQELKEIRKLKLLLNELVNLSRLEKGMIEIKPVPASLKNTITEAVSQIYMKALDKEIELLVEMEEDFTLLHDVKWTTEALVNVLDNAVKYSKRRTSVTLRVRSLVKHVLIEVIDEGMGIKSDELVKIYQRFYRGREAREVEKEGAGVGLYLSRMILERQGGTISAKRGNEKGTVFCITLPC